MKKSILLILLLVLTLALLPAVAEEAETQYDTLIVGHTTKMNGNFFSEVFGNNTADIDVWSLLHGYHLVTWEGEMGVYEYEPMVVAGSTTYASENGNRVYTVVLQDDLFYCDGTPITAADYAFALMLSSAPQITEIGGNANGYDYIEGLTAFKNGETRVLAGVRVPAPNMLQIEIKQEYLPFFYELGMLNICPYPIHVIAPGCEVVDDGEGVYLRDIETQAVPSQIFNAETLKKTLLAEETGYVSHPSVTSGPYMLTAYDAENGVADFDINPYFKGNTQGIKPSIAHLTFRVAGNENVITELQENELGLFNKAVKADTIDAGRELVMEDPSYSMSNYLRNGFSYISYRTEKTALSSVEVRQAIAYCMDADTFVQDYVRNYGMRVYGYYGIGQWMYRLVTGNIMPVEQPDSPTAEEQKAYEEALAAWEQLNLDGLKQYALNTDKAVELLEKDGWVLNQKGEAYDASKDTIRCKKINDELVALDLKLIYPEGNEFGDAVQPLFAQNLATVGIGLTAEAMPFTDLLQVYYHEVESDVDMIYLATNFTIVFEPSGVFDPADAETGMLNRTAFTDEKLYELTVDLRKTEPGDTLTYCKKWIAFQEYWSEVLPAIPIYSNVYFDFYTSALQNYQVGGDLNWSTAIVPAYLSDYMDEEEEEGDFVLFD